MSWLESLLGGVLVLQVVALLFLTLLSLTQIAKWVGISLLLSIYLGRKVMAATRSGQAREH